METSSDPTRRTGRADGPRAADAQPARDDARERAKPGEPGRVTDSQPNREGLPWYRRRGIIIGAIALVVAVVLIAASAGVAVAQASLAQANADVASARATAIRAQQDRKRYETLRAVNSRALARSTVDEAVATARSAAAQQRAAQQRVQSAQAQIASAQAAVVGARARIATAEAGVGQARLNLSYTAVTARVERGARHVEHDPLRYDRDVRRDSDRADVAGRADSFPLRTAHQRGLCRPAGAKTNRASAMISVGRNIGGSVGISLVQALLARREQFHQARLVADLQPLNPVYEHGIRSLTQTLTARGAPPAAASRMALGTLYQMVQRQADMMAFIDVFWALAVFIIVVLPIVFLLRRTPLERGHSRRAQPAAAHGG